MKKMIKSIKDFIGNAKSTPVMPVLFVGHGSPMNAIEDNPFSRKWREVEKNFLDCRRYFAFPRIGNHGTFVTAMPNPRQFTISGGFPCELFNVQYRHRAIRN
jgi:4,5-DOPA dioxygenase extradiol